MIDSFNCARLPVRFGRSEYSHPNFDPVLPGGDILRTRTEFPYNIPIHTSHDFQTHNLTCLCSAFTRWCSDDQGELQPHTTA